MPDHTVRTALVNLQNTRARLLEQSQENRPACRRYQYEQWWMELTNLRSMSHPTVAAHRGISEQLREGLEAWYETSKNAMTAERFLALQVVAQRGLVEITCLFYNVLDKLMEERRCEEALHLLVRVQCLLWSVPVFAYDVWRLAAVLDIGTHV